MNLSYSFTIFTVIICVIVHSETSDGYRILGIFPLNEKSHFAMCEQLMKVLAKRGHQVDVISHYPLKNPFPNYTDFSLKGSVPNVVNNVSYSAARALSTDASKTFIQMLGDPICELLKHPAIKNIINNPPLDPPYDLVIVELFAAQCYLAFGRHLKVPLIAVETSASYNWETEPIGKPQNLAFIPTDFTGLPTKMKFWQRLQNVLVDRLNKIQFNHYLAQQKRYVDQYFGPGYPSIYELSTQPALIFINSHYSLNGIQSLPPGIIEVGGLHIVDRKEKLSPEIQTWLDESENGCIYVTFGSMVKIESFPKEILGALYAAFKNLAPIRFLMKIARREDLPPGLPANVKTNHWFPQLQVLKHKNIKAFITHGGLMGSLESIYCGVPLIGIPLFADQPNNVKLFVEKKIAVLLDLLEITGEKLTEAVNTVLNDPDYRKNIKRTSELYYDRPISSQDSVIFWTEYVIRHGSVLRSPASDLAWYQVHLLDVYGFILFVILSALCIVSFLMKSLLEYVLSSKRAGEDKVSSKKER